MSGIITQGTTFQISSDGVTFEDLGCIQSFTNNAPARAEIDTTCMTDDTKTFKFGIKDNGTISVELLYNPSSAGQALVEGSYNSNDAYKFKIEYNNSLGTNGTIKEFDGFVMSVSQDSQIDDVVRQSVEIKVSGAITTTPAS